MVATTVDEYLANLPADRRAALERVRETVNANLPSGYEEGIGWGTITWSVPLSRYPDTYNKQPLCLAALASQKNYMALYLMTVYGDTKLSAWFKKAFADAGKKLDMGKSCVRFKTLDDLPLDVIGEVIGKVELDRYVEIAKAVRAGTKTAKAKAARKQPTKSAKKSAKPSANKTTKKTTKNKAAAKRR
jgi:hypothetical protein